MGGSYWILEPTPVPLGLGASPARDLTMNVYERVPMRVIAIKGQTFRGDWPGRCLEPEAWRMVERSGLLATRRAIEAAGRMLGLGGSMDKCRRV